MATDPNIFRMMEAISVGRNQDRVLKKIKEARALLMTKQNTDLTGQKSKILRLKVIVKDLLQNHNIHVDEGTALLNITTTSINKYPLYVLNTAGGVTLDYTQTTMKKPMTSYEKECMLRDKKLVVDALLLKKRFNPDVDWEAVRQDWAAHLAQLLRKSSVNVSKLYLCGGNSNPKEFNASCDLSLHNLDDLMEKEDAVAQSSFMMIIKCFWPH